MGEGKHQGARPSRFPPEPELSQVGLRWEPRTPVSRPLEKVFGHESEHFIARSSSKDGFWSLLRARAAGAGAGVGGVGVRHSSHGRCPRSTIGQGRSWAASEGLCRWPLAGPGSAAQAGRQRAELGSGPSAVGAGGEVSRRDGAWPCAQQVHGLPTIISTPVLGGTRLLPIHTQGKRGQGWACGTMVSPPLGTPASHIRAPGFQTQRHS